ncbi:tail fiber protein [Enterobacter sp. RHBSTW-00901]|uniref:tail fiber protein n=1 Tax=Enterobacter sp. RHBSTW-00901 TaxID=2742669 RepID=UPI002017EBE0|nr:tail fiber protein [Enterobacter sp. RHBSTW-00901]
MSQTAITLAFEEWKASQSVTGESVLLDEFVFANVPGLDAGNPVDRNEVLPPDAQIVHRQAVSRKGVVNENAVVHSVVLGADVGDFSFNWIGLTNKASNTLAMIVHAPLQQKLKTKDGQQGNVLTRSFLMEFNGAQNETEINTPAETWQIDFTARMAGMDERQRLENIDIYGVAAFFGDGYLVAKNGSQFFVNPGVGYVRGLRTQLAASQNIVVTTRPVNVWLDVTWTGTLTSAWAVESKIVVADTLADYVQNGVQHFVFAVASIDANGSITDLRPKGTLNDQSASDALARHEKSRNHPDATTEAKGFTQLSSATDSQSETLAATPKAVKAVRDIADGKYTAQDATTAQKGIVQLSSATDSTSEVLAATPKAVKTVRDIADGKYTAQDATTAQKGIVQLSSATDSTSETLAATPKAVKAVRDLADGKYTAQDASLWKKGIVQLSSATDSLSESFAATPKAVKAVTDYVTALIKSLGTAASKNAQETRDDITPGRLLVNGGALALRTVAARAGTAIADASALPANSVSFCYSDAAFSPGYEATILDVGGLGGDGYRVQYAASYADGGKRLKFRTLNADNGYWGAWTSVLTNHGGSVSYLDGATYYSTNKNTWAGCGSFADQYGNNIAPFLHQTYTTPKDVSIYLPLIKGISQTEYYGFGSAVSFGILRTGKNDFGSAVIQVIGDNGAGAIYKFTSDGIFNAPSQILSGGVISAAGDIISNGGNLRAGGYVACGGNVVAGAGVFESGGNVRVYSSNNPPPKVAYTEAESDWRFQPKGSYASPNTAWWNGSQMVWRCGSTGAMRMSAVVGGVPNGGRVSFPSVFPNACRVVIPTRNEEPGNGAALQPFNVDQTGFNLRIAGGGTVNLMYTAEGY